MASPSRVAPREPGTAIFTAHPISALESLRAAPHKIIHLVRHAQGESKFTPAPFEYLCSCAVQLA